MIVVKLMGGLGNQMFQYAVGRHLSLQMGAPLKLDLTWFEEIPKCVTPRHFLLGSLNVNGEAASAAEIEALKKVNKLYYLFRRVFNFQLVYQRERHFHFDPAVLLLKGDVYLDGYWQSDRYFSEVAGVIRQELSLKHPPSGPNKILSEQIIGRNQETVAVHFRRGDYITDPTIAKYHGTCPANYYNAAIDMIFSYLSNPYFYVFSDDPQWAQENFHSRFPFRVVSHNGPDDAAEDLRLMMLCRHHIIANSTFSWWGAWLCRNPDKVVIAPHRWFNDPKINTKDLIPHSWLRI